MKIVLRIFLSKLGHWPYFFALEFIILVSKFFNLDAEIWARNSYKLKALEPGYSDLDITIKIEKIGNTRRLQSFFNFYTKMQQIFPLFGEINIYTHDTTAFLLKNHNSVELMRDPTLCVNFGFDKTADSIEAAVFLFRNLEADIHNVINNPSKRIKKWRSHINLIDKARPDLTIFMIDFKEDHLFETIIFYIIYLCGVLSPLEMNELKDKLYLYFELLNKRVDFINVTYLINNDSWFAALRSYRDIGTNFSANNFSDKQMQFLVRQLKWEVCGVLTQIKSKKTANQAAAHFSKIISAVHMISYQISTDEARKLLITVNEALAIAKKI